MSDGRDVVEVRIEDDGAGRIADLHRWLRDDPRLQPVLAREEREPRPGEMNVDLSDALVAAIASKELLVALVGGVSGWLVARAQTRRTKVRVRCGEREIEIDSVAVSDPEVAVRQLLAELGENHPGAAS